MFLTKNKIAIELKNVSKVYPNGALANANIDIKFSYGKIHTLFGENGAGKTTMIKILLGETQISEGEIFLNQQKCLNYNSAKAKKMNIAFVHQHFNLINNFTIYENIILGNEWKTKEERQKLHEQYYKEFDALQKWFSDQKFNEKIEQKYQKKLQKLKQKFKKKKFLFFYQNQKLKNDLQKTIAKFDLKLDLKKVIQNVSVNKKQKTEILRTIFLEAQIIIFDEPTSVLSKKEIAIFLTSLKKYKKEGKAIIFISHKLDEIREISDEITVLRQGKIVGKFENTKTLKNETLIDLALGKKELQKIKGLERKTFKNEKILQIKDLSYKVKGQQKLKNINLTIKKGEIVGLAGLEENGQKEFLEIICGLLKPSKGQIDYFNNQKKHLLHKQNPVNIKSLGISYVPQDRQNEGLILNQSLTFNAVFNNWKDQSIWKKYLFNYFLQSKEAKIRTIKIIENYQVLGVQSLNQKMESLSGGNQQKFLIGRELETNPSLLLIHEPTWGIDVGTINHLNKLFLKIRDQRKTILFASSDLGEILTISDRIFVINKGEIFGPINASDVEVIQKIGKILSK